MPNVLSPGDLVSRPDVMDETVPHTYCSFTTEFISDIFLCCSEHRLWRF